jgi:hypothetical protein
MFTILFTNARNEPNIAEWIAHHLILGFDKIVIFDHESDVPIYNQLYGNNFDKKVHIMRIKGKGDIKHVYAKLAIKIARIFKADWMLYLDADEFLYLKNFSDIKTTLNTYSTSCDALSINWLMFGSSGHKVQPKGLLIENFTMSNKILDQHVKTFVRPKCAIDIHTPHNYIIINPKRVYAITGNKHSTSPFNPVNKTFEQVPAYIAHYYVQSEEEYRRRKCRPMDDGTPPRPINFDFNTSNEVINEELKNKYSQGIKDFLKKYNIIL